MILEHACLYGNYMICKINIIEVRHWRMEWMTLSFVA